MYNMYTGIFVFSRFRLLEITISVYVLVAIIKKWLKIAVRFHTILQILSLIIFEQIQ